MYVPKPLPPAFTVARWLFARGLGVVFFCAFASLLPQIPGLIGTQGISPAGIFLEAAEKNLGSSAYWQVPTLAWLDASDGMLRTMAFTGLGLSFLMIVGVAPGACSLLLWTLYLSFASISSPFLDFPWDSLLLETSLLAAIALPWKLRPQWESFAPLPRFGRWLLWWLLFRLIFESGLVKLTGAPSWRDLSALDFHFATQPLPVWISWYLHQAPRWLLHGAVIVIFAIELLVPFLIFVPHRWKRLRHIGACVLIGYQVLVFLSGNYAFYNLLTIVLCLFLFEDTAWPRWLRACIVPPVHYGLPTARPRLALASAVFAILVALLSLPATLTVLQPTQKWSNPLRSFNRYRLFSGVSTERREVVIEGSNDGGVWKTYEFKWKPGEPRNAPRWAAPHQPRLDWQMWVAALSGPERNPWFAQLLGRLLGGSPEVLALLEHNPFPDKPPQTVRAVLYSYRFTKPGEPGWWQCEIVGLYHAPVELTPAPGATSAR
jgi:hypothetical protein